MKTTEQQIGQMVSSYLLRNPKLLYSLKKIANSSPIPMRQRDDSVQHVVDNEK